MSKLKVKLAYGVLIMLIIIAGVSACTAETAEPEYANQMAESALQGVNDSAYAKFTEYFSPAVKITMTETAFGEKCEQVKSLIGDYIDKDFWKTETTEEGYTDVYYKARFSDEPEDVLVWVRFEERSGETYIYDFQLQSPKLNTLATSTTPATSTGE
jgi:hypothetical protein